MTEQEIQKALESKFTELQNDLKDAQDKGASKDEVVKLHDAIKAQGQALQDFIEQQKSKEVKTFKQDFRAWLQENDEEIKEIHKRKSGEIEYTSKVVGDVSLASGTDQDTPPVVLGASISDNFNLRNDAALLNLCSVTSTGDPAFGYTEMLPKEGGYAFVAEGGTKPQIDFKWETRYLTPHKAAAYQILTEEAATDYARLESVASSYLRQQHDLFKVNGIYFGDGTGANPTGATVYARTFVSTSMVDVFPLGGSNFMDVVNAIITDIYRTQAYTDEDHFMPNIVLINPIDFFIQLVGAKDNDGLPLYPTAGLFNEVRIGGVVIKPWIKIPSGKIFVADMTRYRVANYIPFSVRIGWINDQFITNKFTMVGESRFYSYVRNLEQAAFVYDDIATVQAAITAAV